MGLGLRDVIELFMEKILFFFKFENVITQLLRFTMIRMDRNCLFLFIQKKYHNFGKIVIKMFAEILNRVSTIV